MSTRLPTGLYERLMTAELADLLERTGPNSPHREVADLDVSEAPRILTQHVTERVLAALKAVPNKDGLEGQLRLANAVLHFTQAQAEPGTVEAGDAVVDPARQLLALIDSKQGGLAKLVSPERPSIPLNTSALLVNGPRDLSIGPEIQKELASADRVDLLISFLKWNGLRVLRSSLEEFLERNPSQLRVLTTTYMGVTDTRVLTALEEMGAEIKVSYDTRRTRLHAKAWLFHRQSGYSTAIIGSSNLSVQALLDGLEWNVRLSKTDNRGILERFEGVFEQYWQEGEFEPFDAEKFETAIRATDNESKNRLLVHIDVRPYPFQQAILDRLEHERSEGHTRNLLVAATGTGKTVVAALDFRRLRSQLDKPTLLFVAHRKEILQQSLDTFRVVLKDGDFGELMVAGRKPEKGRHVFASIQSLHKERLEAVDPDFYDVVIVDEFHHAAAPTYTSLLNHVKPKILLGLTATPERTDGRNAAEWFDNRVAAELRLWHALEQELLCSFQYFAVADGTDLRNVGWKRGRYVESDLENIYTASDIRLKRILREVHNIVEDPQTMRAVGFCVSIAHAEFMAKGFNEVGISAEALTSHTNQEDRDAALRKLEAGEVNALFAVDIFNEGVDVPAIDTVLFLRPTESALIFLQQLGRGLRHAEGKQCLTVLDFVGHPRREFRFDLRYRALVGGTRKEMESHITKGFPHLPPGCSIHLDKTAQEIVLDNIRQAIGGRWKNLVEDYKGLDKHVTLASFLEKAEVDLADLYAGQDKGWTRLRRDANRETRPQQNDEKGFARGLSRMLHINDNTRLSAWLNLLRSGKCPRHLAPDRPEDRLLFMLAAGIDPDRSLLKDLPRILSRFIANQPLREEAIELFQLLKEKYRVPTRPNPLAFAAPMLVHADYSLMEIMAALAITNKDKTKLLRPQAGVFWVRKHRCSLLFVTLEKSEKDYSPTTLYKDYPISSTRFHWQSQSTTREESETGQRYIHHQEQGSHVALFVRRKRLDARGATMPYKFLGPAKYLYHQDERPMSITWKLQIPMPLEMFEETKMAAG